MKRKLMKLAGFATCLLWSVCAFAEEAAATGAKGGDHLWALAIASGIGIGIAAFGGALGQGKAAAATLEGIARNPAASGKLFTPMIIALALIESLVIYALVIAFLLLGKI